jgi:hypothetical protein
VVLQARYEPPPHFVVVWYLTVGKSLDVAPELVKALVHAAEQLGSRRRHLEPPYLWPMLLLLLT